MITSSLNLVLYAADPSLVFSLVHVYSVFISRTKEGFSILRIAFLLIHRKKEEVLLARGCLENRLKGIASKAAPEE